MTRARRWIPQVDSAGHASDGSEPPGDDPMGNALVGIDFPRWMHLILEASGSTIGAIWLVKEGRFSLQQEVGLLSIGLGHHPPMQLFHETALESLVDRFRTEGIASQPLCQETIEEGRRFRFLVAQQAGEFFVFETVDEREPRESLGEFQRKVLLVVRSFPRQSLDRLSVEETPLPSGGSATALLRLHRDTDFQATAYRIANEGVGLLDVDRMSVFRVRDGKAQGLAVSGVATIDRRAQQILRMEEVASAIARGGMMVMYPASNDFPPQLEQVFGRMMEETHAQSIVGIPLHSPSDADSSSSPQCIGLLLLENFQDRDLDQSVLSLFTSHAEIALHNALAVSEIPFSGWRMGPAFRMWRSRPGRALLSTMALCATCLVLMVWPAELEIEANGMLQPSGLRHVYAPMHGEVESVQVGYRSDVQTGDVLLQMKSRDLDLRKEELATQRSITMEKLRGIEAMRLRDRKNMSLDSNHSIELSATERELRETLKSQDQQMEILNEMTQSLQVRSPVSGTVITWDVENNLERRPFQQGQRLLSVADLDSEGLLDLQLLEEDARHVLQRFKTSDQIPVTYSVASEPGSKHRATLKRVGTAVESDERGLKFIRVEAMIDKAAMPKGAPFAHVVAKIQCGRSSVAYIWTRRLIDFLRIQFS